MTSGSCSTTLARNWSNERKWLLLAPVTRESGAAARSRDRIQQASNSKMASLLETVPASLYGKNRIDQGQASTKDSSIQSDVALRDFVIELASIIVEARPSSSERMQACERLARERWLVHSIV